jgi:hypothetical protein
MASANRQTQTSEYKAGFAAGREWARTRASHEQLGRIADLREEHSGYEWDEWFNDMASDYSYTAAESLALFVAGTKDWELSLKAAQAFWDEVGIGCPVERMIDSFARGFAEGAYALWQDVQSQL